MIGGKQFGVGITIGGKLDPTLQRSIKLAEAKVGGLAGALNRAAGEGRKGLLGTLGNAAFQASAAAATGLTLAIGGSIKAAVEFDTKMADIRKAITFADGAAGAKRFGKELVKLSTTMPFTAGELSEIAAAAGFAGYKESEIIPFTKAAARMGVAFQMTAGQAGEAMVALRAGMALTQPQVETLGNAINYLSDTFQGTVNAADLTEVTRRIGAIGKASGLTAEQVAGLGAAFLASGTPTEIAATGLKNFLNALTNGDNLAKGKQEALATIFGTTSDVQSRIDDLADATGKGVGKIRKGLKDERKQIVNETAESIAASMQVDPEATIKRVVTAIARLPAAQRPGVVSKLFGEESKAAIMPLLENPKLLAQAFDLVADKSAFAGSMQKEFQNQMATTSAQAKIAKNGLNAIGVSIGSALLPPINKLLKVITPGLVKFAEWAQANEKLTLGITLFGAALVGLVAIAPGLMATIGIIGSLSTALAAMNIGATIAGSLGAIGPILAAITGPIGLAVLAVVGIGLAFVAAYKHVDWFRNGVDKWMVSFKTGWSGLMTAIGGAWDIFAGIFTLDGQRMQNGWRELTEGMRRMWNGFTGTIAALFGVSIKRVQGSFDILVGAWQFDLGKMGRGWAAMTEGFGPAFGRAMKAIGKAFKDLGTQAQRQWQSMGKNSGERFVNAFKQAFLTGTLPGWIASAFMREAPRIPTGLTLRSSPADYPGRAMGGQVTRGVDYLVGEHRPEVFRPQQSGRVFPSVQAASRSLPGRLPTSANASPHATPAGRRGPSGPLMVMEPGAIQVTVGSGDPGTVERAVAAALDRFRYELQSTYRSLLSD
jgi:TP901 family phage tail tape measure protein